MIMLRNPYEGIWEKHRSIDDMDLILHLPIFMEHGLRTKKWLIGLQFNLQRFLKYSKNLI